MVIQLIQLQQSAFPIRRAAEHGLKLSAIHQLIRYVGSALLHGVGEVIVKGFYENQDLQIGIYDSLFIQTIQRAFLIDAVYERPAQRQGIDTADLQRQGVKAAHRFAVYLLYQRGCHSAFHFREVIVFVGSRAQHQSLAGFIRSDEHVVAEAQVGLRPREARVQQTRDEREGQNADKRFYGGNDIGPEAHRRDVAIANRSQGLGRKEKSLQEAVHLVGAVCRAAYEFFHANHYIRAGKQQVDRGVKQQDTQQKAHCAHAQQSMIEADALVERQSGFRQVDAAVFIGQAIAFRATAAGEAGVFNIFKLAAFRHELMRRRSLCAVC